MKTPVFQIHIPVDYIMQSTTPSVLFFCRRFELAGDNNLKTEGVHSK
jgi:hypothetical protein